MKRSYKVEFKSAFGVNGWIYIDANTPEEALEEARKKLEADEPITGKHEVTR